MTRAEYAAAREELLERIWRGLEADRRVAAAWLTGSYGRGEQDEVSDIDVQAVIDAPLDGELCAVAQPVRAGSPPARLELFSRFGEPVNIHENHNNAPAGGTFSAVLYRDPPVIVDWTLIPLATARRPADTRLLFDRVGIEIASGLIPIGQVAGEPVDRMAERLAFFWMMAVVTAKYIVREDEAADVLLGFVEEVVGDLVKYSGEEFMQQPTAGFEGKITRPVRLRGLCDRITGMKMGDEPRAAVEAILRLAEEKTPPGFPLTTPGR